MYFNKYCYFVRICMVHFMNIFFARPCYRCRHSHTRAHTHPYECTHAHPTPMNTSEELSWTGKSRDWRSHHRRLVIDGHFAYNWKITPLNPGKNLGEYEHPCQVGDLNPGGHVSPRGTQPAELRSIRLLNKQPWHTWSCRSTLKGGTTNTICKACHKNLAR